MSVRRLISSRRRAKGFVEHNWARSSFGKVMQARTLASVASWERRACRPWAGDCRRPGAASRSGRAQLPWSRQGLDLGLRRWSNRRRLGDRRAGRGRRIFRRRAAADHCGLFWWSWINRAVSG
jgi:hypothetical protein